MDSKYELIYHVCSDQNCENYIDKPEGLIIDYSSKTTDPITGSITSTGTKTMRIISTNTTANTLYVKLDINAGYSYNTLALKNMISNEYDESDVSIIAYVNGTLASAFPTTNKYRSYVSCTVNGSATTATGTSIWNGTEWVVTLNNIKANNTRCNVSFVNPEPLYQAILNDNGGADSITTKDSFVSGENITTNLGLFKMPDNYGTSYYYRGAVDTNWVKFGAYSQDVYYSYNSGLWQINLYDTLSACQATSTNVCTKMASSGDPMYWRIIRINGDNSVRMIYTGTSAPQESTKVVPNYYGTGIGTTRYNSAGNNDNAYVGYVYTKGQVHGNGTSSTIKTYTEAWYSKYLSKYDSMISDEIFCSDRTPYLVNDSGVLVSGGGTGTAATYYGGYYRNLSKVPRTTTFMCSDKLDSLTKSDSQNGTAVLAQKVGLITADELNAAGSIDSTINYLHVQANLVSPSSGTLISKPYNTMTPYFCLYYDTGSTSDGATVFTSSGSMLMYHMILTKLDLSLT